MRSSWSVIALVVLAPNLAAAHLYLHAPTAWYDQGLYGDPQHTSPCGAPFDGADTTGVVTPYTAGEVVTVTIEETIWHPGHFRVALAVNDRSELPIAPPVVADTTDCGSVPIQDPPVFPVLADGVLQHTSPLDPKTQSFQVTLPTDVTCEKCTLQVLTFTAQHGAPCFEYHCADISIAPPCDGNDDCTDADPCTDDTCDLGTGKCSNTGTCECDANDDCIDADPCTTDTCDPATGECANVDTCECRTATDCDDQSLCTTDTCDDANECSHVAITCSDDQVCTRDACVPTEGCTYPPLTLADVSAGFLGSLSVDACSGTDLPGVIANGFTAAEGFVEKAAGSPEKAKRFLKKASKKLKKVTKKTQKLGGKKFSPDCATALLAVLEPAQARVQCLMFQP